MNCKFVTNGIALSYDHIVKPCCMFKHNNWDHTVHNTDLNNWVNSEAVKTIKGQLEQDIWQ